MYRLINAAIEGFHNRRAVGFGLSDVGYHLFCGACEPVPEVWLCGGFAAFKAVRELRFKPSVRRLVPLKSCVGRSTISDGGLSVEGSGLCGRDRLGLYFGLFHAYWALVRC